MNVQALKQTSVTSTRFVQTQKDPMSVAVLKDIKAGGGTVQVIREVVNSVLFLSPELYRNFKEYI